MWISQELADEEYVIVDTATEPGELLPYMRVGEVVPPDMVLVIVNMATLDRMKRVWLESPMAKTLPFSMQEPGAEIAAAMISMRCQKEPQLAVTLGWRGR